MYKLEFGQWGDQITAGRWHGNVWLCLNTYILHFIQFAFFFTGDIKLKGVQLLEYLTQVILTPEHQIYFPGTFKISQETFQE